MTVHAERAQLFRGLRLIALAALAAPLAGCDWGMLDPAGDIARQQMQLVGISTLLMLLIIVPVMALTAWFAFKYRASNTDAPYNPDWDHSTRIEFFVWGAPLLIIIALGSITWVSTHLLDPWRKLDRLAPGVPVPANVKPLEVDVVALDWKWLFIYPEQGIATDNLLVLPTNRPLTFRITSTTVMNSFFVPRMAGQIYAMPGMETKLHAVLNEPMTGTGFSANISGDGFSKMHFPVKGVSEADFASWVQSAKQAGGTLDTASYLALTKPTEGDASRLFASATPGIFDRIVNLCVEPGKMCESEMMAIDARGGTGKAGVFNMAMLSYDKYGRPGSVPYLPGRAEVANAKKFVAAYCAQNPGKARGVEPESDAPAPQQAVDASKRAPHLSLAAHPARPLS